jgi:hypothetical protein
MGTSASAVPHREADHGCLILVMALRVLRDNRFEVRINLTQGRVEALAGSDGRRSGRTRRRRLGEHGSELRARRLFRRLRFRLGST